MPDLRKRVNAKDPSGLRATENRRAAEAQRDFDDALKRILERVQREGATTPAAVQRIVEDELSAYERETTDKVVQWVQDTSDRAVIRSERLLKAGGVKVQAVLGPREASLFPTRVGMNRNPSAPGRRTGTVPHASGDEPLQERTG